MYPEVQGYQLLKYAHAGVRVPGPVFNSQTKPLSMSEPRRISEKYKERPEVVAVSYGTDAGEAVVTNQPRKDHRGHRKRLAGCQGVAASLGISVHSVESALLSAASVCEVPTEIDTDTLTAQLAPPTYNRRQRRAAVNKGQRTQIEQRKFAQRLSNLGIPWEDRHKAFAFKSSGRPCSCWACKRERYKREPKHRHVTPTP